MCVGLVRLPLAGTSDKGNVHWNFNTFCTKCLYLFVTTILVLVPSWGGAVHPRILTHQDSTAGCSTPLNVWECSDKRVCSLALSLVQGWQTAQSSHMCFYKKMFLRCFPTRLVLRHPQGRVLAALPRSNPSSFPPWTEEMFSCRMLSLVDEFKSIHYHGALPNQVPKDVSIVGCAMGRCWTSWASWASWTALPWYVLCPTAQHTTPGGATKFSVYIMLHI
jgi:hypothetical protein